jgi:c-di-GMP-binding flagellar brake protein YcgR
MNDDAENSLYKMYKERRKHLRLPTTYSTRYKLRYSGANYDVNHTKDISQGGALLFTNRSFAKGEQLEMLIRFPFSQEEIAIIAEVVFSEESVKNSVYETRLKFIEINEEVKRILGEVINRRKNMNEL